MTVEDSLSIIELPDADILLRSCWVQKVEADNWFRVLREQTPWQQPRLTIFGKERPVPRLVAWYGDEGACYRYSGHTHQPLPWTTVLTQIRLRVQETVEQPLNAVLLNYYRDGQDSMGWHSDDEPELGIDPLIASLNLGATRRFDFRRKGSSRITHSIQLKHGSLLVMRGATQHYWQHQVAKTRSCREPRLNMTFRLIRNIS